MSFQLGQTYGNYEFIDVQESSPLGVSYKIRNHALMRIELLRVLSRSEDERDPIRAERFLREADVHARLAHPNIVTFYGATLLEGQFVITTELVEGTTLAERLELGPLPIEKAIADISQALSALQCAHQLGIVHRDIRPANLILTPEGIIKLSGFTFAKANKDTQVTQFGASIGDVHYLSPEQVKGDMALDPRSDIYSVGIVLYEMLTGRRPFESSSEFEVMLGHVAQAPAPPRDVNPSIPAELEAVVLKAMAKEPASRFPSAAAFLAAIESLTARLQVEVPAPESDTVQLPFPHAAPRSPEGLAPVPEPELAPVMAEDLPGTLAAQLPEDLAAMQFGLREAVVLGLGILVMVASVLIASHG